MSDKKVSTYESLLDEVMDYRLRDVHTAIPAIVDSFDSSTQTARVSPSIRRIYDDGTLVEIPPIIGVPVCYPNAGGWGITFPVAQGDECLIVFSERSIDNWLSYGGVQDPFDRRMHDFTDAFAILGARSNPRALSGYSTDSLQIRNDSKSTYINVTNDAITLEINGGGATLNSDGSVDFANGAQLTSTGDFVTASGISLDNHTHTITNVANGTQTRITTVPA